MESGTAADANIFLAGDNYNALTAIKTLLVDIGYKKGETFPNGNELLFELEKCRPDLIISDVCMPQVDGFQLLREIRAAENSGRQPIPVILFSATFNDFETRKLANDLGAEAFFTVPFDNVDFMASVKKALAKHDGGAPPHRGENHAETIRLAILEDDRFSSRFLLHALKDLKYELTAVETIAEFNAAFQNRLPHICIIDYNLPDGDGIDVLRTVKSRDPNAKVIMMTALANERIIDDFIKEGADNFVNKPINIRNLITAIKDAVESLRGAENDAAPVGEKERVEQFGRDFSMDYGDYFVNAPLALAIIDEKLNCIRHNFEFDVTFKNLARNPRLLDDHGAVNLEQILDDLEIERLKTVLADLKRKDTRLKYQFTFTGGRESKQSMLIRAASNTDIVKNNYIFYIAISG